MALKSKKLLVVIPTYNEEKIIDKTIKEVVKELKKLSVDSKLLIVNDGSKDQTSKIIKKAAKNSKRIIILEHKTNKGYGAGIQTGIKYAIDKKYAYALFMDSDLTNSPKDIKKFANEMNADFDCVKASRYINGGKVINVPTERVLISKIGNLIASMLFNVKVKDCTNGFLMIKPAIFKNINLTETGFPIIMEEMYYLKKKNANFKEIPVTLINRKSGTSSFIYSISTFYNYIKYPIKSLWH